MLLYILILSSLLITGYKCQDCTPPQSENAGTRIMKKILCGYDTSVRPVTNDSQMINVNIKLWIKSIEMRDEYSGTLSLFVHSWMMWGWKDQFLQWNPESYENVKQLHISSEKIWLPDIVLVHSNDMSSSEQIFVAKCDVSSDGSVTCIPPTVHQASCTTDFSNWPFDSHKCTVKLSSWGHMEDKINLTFAYDGISLGIYETNPAWDLIDTKAYRNILKFDQAYGFSILFYDFIIKRHSGTFTAVVFVPALMMAALLLSTFWVNPEADSRVYLCCTNIFAHILYLQYLEFALPVQSEKCPKIVFLYQNSLLLTACSLIVSIILRNLCTNLNIPPIWAIRPFHWFQNNRFGQVILYPHFTTKIFVDDPEIGDNQLMNSQETSTVNWCTVVRLLDRLMFYVFFILFMCTVLIYIPVP